MHFNIKLWIEIWKEQQILQFLCGNHGISLVYLGKSRIAHNMTQESIDSSDQFKYRI